MDPSGFRARLHGAVGECGSALQGDFYAPKHERTILWNDAAIKIDWPRKNRAILSAKDLAGNTLDRAEVYEQMGQSAENTPARAVVR